MGYKITRVIERDGFRKIKPSRSITLFDRVVQTSGDCASRHHALALFAMLIVACPPASAQQKPNVVVPATGGKIAGTPATARDVIFTVRDRLAFAEIEEVTTIHVDGRMIASFHLGAEEPDITVKVAVPDAATHRYTLCGHLILRDSDGKVIRREVDAAGSLHDAEGRNFEAVAGEGFTRFYLVDVTPDRVPAEIDVENGPACAAVISRK